MKTTDVQMETSNVNIIGIEKLFPFSIGEEFWQIPVDPKPIGDKRELPVLVRAQVEELHTAVKVSYSTGEILLVPTKMQCMTTGRILLRGGEFIEAKVWSPATVVPAEFSGLFACEETAKERVIAELAAKAAQLAIQ